MRYTAAVLSSLIACCMSIPAFALTTPTDVQALDVPNDDGGRGIVVRWAYEPTPDDPVLDGFVILRRTADTAEMTPVGNADVAARSYNDASAAPDIIGKTKLREDAIAYVYAVRAEYGAKPETPAQEANSPETAPTAARANWYHHGHTPLLIAVALFGLLLYYLTRRARAGVVPRIRRIAGLEAVDEAVGRATEMGRSILYVSGIGAVSQVATIASINIFSHVTKRAGEYGTPMRAPCSDPIVMQVLQTVSEQAYTDIGRPDAYRPEDVFFLTQSQFAYAAAVDGIMVRERPAAIFLQGIFYAESLILAETGNSIGAIQIAGTDRDAQLPFFIAACDYTLIGEELFAASAYLSQDGPMLSTIRSQDLAKAVLMACLLIGVVLQLFGIDWIAHFFSTPSA